jgi:hypothetical protein
MDTYPSFSVAGEDLDLKERTLYKAGKILLSDELHNLYFLADIVRIIYQGGKEKSDSVKRNKGKNAHIALVRKHEKRPIARTMLR